MIDVDGGAIPGATITARGEAFTQTIVSGADGRFRLTDLEPGVYRVQVELPGFETVSAERVVVGSGAAVECHVALRIGDHALVFHSLLGAKWPEILGAADLVARFRVTTVIGPGPSAGYFDTPARMLTMEYEARASSVIKGAQHLGPGQTFRFLQLQAGARGADGGRLGGEEPAYRVGDEFIGFFARDVAGRLMSLESGAFMFPIVNGRISWRREQPAGVRNGMTVDEFLSVIRR